MNGNYELKRSEIRKTLQTQTRSENFLNIYADGNMIFI